MSDQPLSPTRYPFVNETVGALLVGLHEILGSELTGFYLGGSLASGDFNPNRSDIDFMAVTRGGLSAAQVRELKELHMRLSAGTSKWGHELEGSYVPLPALRRYDPDLATFPVIERGGELRIEFHDSYWVVNRFVFRQNGITVLGPEIHALVDPISAGELRRAVLGVLDYWWAPMLTDPTKLAHPGYQDYAVLTMCRMLYTLYTGEVASKPAAARWAQASLDPRWRGLIEHADTWEDGQPFDHMGETLDFIQYTLDQSHSWDNLRL